MKSTTGYIIGALCAFILFMLMTSILICNETKAPINRLTRFTTIIWLDQKLTNPNGLFPDSMVLKDFHHTVVDIAMKVHHYLEYGYVKALFAFKCICLLLISLVCIALHFATKSRDWHKAQYFRREWGDRRFPISENESSSSKRESYERIPTSQDN